MGAVIVPGYHTLSSASIGYQKLQMNHLAARRLLNPITSSHLCLLALPCSPFSAGHPAVPVPCVLSP
jgi:hypothetical protein